MSLAKATHEQMRSFNRSLVLRTIYDSRSISRAEVARATGLTRTTVSDLVSDLIGSGLAEETGRGPSSGGKAPILLRVVDDSRLLIGLDLGDKVFRGAIVDLRGRIVRSLEVDAGDFGEDGSGALERAFRLVDTLVQSTDRQVLGIGIGTAGVIDTTVGTVVNAVNLGWRDLPLGALLRARTSLPVYVVNDSQATALAEHVFGGFGGANLAVVKVGQGVGAGLVIDGRLYQGDGFGAGEIGHTTVLENGDLCGCGRRGCLETLTSSRAILGRLSMRAPQTAWSLATAIAAFQAGDPVVRAVVLEAGHELGRGVAWLIGALNVQRVVLVGSVTGFGEPWLEAVRENAIHGALPLLAQETTVEIGQLHEDGVILGASALLMTHELGLNLTAAARRAVIVEAAS